MIAGVGSEPRSVYGEPFGIHASVTYPALSGMGVKRGLSMKKLLLAALAAVISSALVGPSAWAQNAKFEAIIDNVKINVGSDNTTADDDDVVSRLMTVKLPGNKALLLGVSSQIGITTDTKVVGKNGGGGTATATGTAAVCVAVVPTGTDPAADGSDCAAPGEITFNSRTQELSAVLGGVIESCTDVNLDGTIDVATECEVTDEEIGLLLDTLSAHHYNFVWQAPATGVYDVILTVSAETSATTVDTGDKDGTNTSRADVVVGPTVLTSEEVRPAKEGIAEFND